jgi:hypothetical protein
MRRSLLGPRLILFAVPVISACVPTFAVHPVLADQRTRVLQAVPRGDGDFDLGRFQVRAVQRGLITSVSASALASRGPIAVRLAAFAAWQSLAFHLLGPEPGQSWSAHCTRWLDPDEELAGLSCELDQGLAPAWNIDLGGDDGRISGRGVDLHVGAERAWGRTLGYHAFAEGEPVASIRVRRDQEVVLASQARSDTRTAGTVLGVALIAAEAFAP